MHVRPGYALFISSALRRAVDLPVVGVGRFKDPLQADKAIVEGHCDLVGVVRGQIADPDFVAQGAGGRPRVDPTLPLLQPGVRRPDGSQPLARLHREPCHRPRAAWPCPTGAARGGGSSWPGAARAGSRQPSRPRGAATRSPSSSATTRSADRSAGRRACRARAEFGDLVRNQLAEALRLGVQVKTGTEVDRDLVLAEGPDVVVVATGARPVRPWWAEAAGDQPAGEEAPAGVGRAGGAAGAPVPRLADVRDVLEGRVAPSGRVLVVDEIGFHQATSVAELLADRGCVVEVASPAMVVGQDLGVTLDMEHWWYRATAKGIAQHSDTLVTGLVPGGATVTDLMTGAPGRCDADWVVVAAPQQPCDELYLALHALVGVAPPARTSTASATACAPRRAHAAVVEGERGRGQPVIALIPVRGGRAAARRRRRRQPRPAATSCSSGRALPERPRRSLSGTAACAPPRPGRSPQAPGRLRSPRSSPTSTSSSCRPRPTGATSAPGSPPRRGAPSSPARVAVAPDRLVVHPAR